MAMRPGALHPAPHSASAALTKSVKVLRLRSSLPSRSYHDRPISPPPRTCAMATATPLSHSDSASLLKVAS